MKPGHLRRRRISGLGQTGRAAVAYLMLAGLQRGVVLLILPFISRVMSPSEYGAASMLTATSILLVALLATPLDALVFRTAPRGGDDAPGILRVAGLYCYVVLPLVGMLIAAGFAMFVPDLLGVDGKIWAIEIVAIAFQPAMTVFALPMVKSHQDLIRFAWLAGSSIVILASTKMILIVGMRLSLMGWVISDLVTALLSAVLAMALVRPPRTRVSMRHIHSVARFAIPLIPHQASYWAITSLTRPALAAVSTLAQVGLLSIGLNVASTVTIAMTEINRAVQPLYSRESFPAPTERTFSPVRWQIVLSVMIPAATAALFALFGQWVFPQSYWPAFPLTGILLIGQAAYGLYPIAINYLVLTAGLPKYSVLATGAGASIILVSILIFGADFGAFGIACATAIGYIAMASVAFGLTRLAKLEIQWHAWSKCWPEFTAGAAALTFGVAALGSSVGSSQSRVLAVIAVVLVTAAAARLLRNRAYKLTEELREK